MATAQINIINNSSNEHLHVAIYQKMDGPSMLNVAWRVASLSIGSTASLSVPDVYAIQVRYNRKGVNYRTRCLPINNYAGAYLVGGEENCIKLSEATDVQPDRRIVVAADANTGFGVGVCALLSGNPVYGPVYINPTTQINFGIRPGFFFIALVNADITAGSYLEGNILTETETAIRPDQTITISSNDEGGYTFAVKQGLDTAECA